MTKGDAPQLNLPEQDLKRLSVGSRHPKKLTLWVANLPPMNLGECARQLYHYLQELNRLPLDYKKRTALLEVLSPAVERVSEGIGKHYLNQPLVLPEKARKVASLAQALQGHLATGYKQVAMDASESRSREAHKHLALASYRAISLLSLTLLRCYKLYFSTPLQTWQEIHQLYWLAEREDVHLRSISRDDTQTPENAWLRALLLAMSRPNQLRQPEIQQVFAISKDWGELVDIHNQRQEQELFAVDLSADRAPVYDHQLADTSEDCRFIDTRRLIQRLSVKADIADLNHLDSLSPSLLAHLRQAWGSFAERSFRRIHQEGNLELCLGIASVHYFASDKQPFQHGRHQDEHSAFDMPDSDNPFLGQRPSAAKGGDPWGQIYDQKPAIIGASIDISDIKSSLHGSDEETGTHFDSHYVKKINASPGGYCLSWQGTTPKLLRTGELVALRDGHPEWAIGVVRWVRQLSRNQAEFGLEVMSPRAEPCAARTIKKVGENGAFQRALLLPALEAIGQPVTLLLPRTGFRAGGRVELKHKLVKQGIKLTRQFSNTASFVLYQFMDEGENTTVKAAPPRQEEGQFDSIWSSL